MARIADVWDGTTQVLAARAGPIAAIAAAGVFVPNVVGQAVKAFAPPSPGTAALVAVIGLVALLASLWAGLAIIALAADRAADRAEAGRLALARLPKNLLVVIVLVGAVVALFLPIGIALATSGFDWQALAAAQAGGAMPAVSPGAAAFVTLYALAVLAALLWVSARLFLVNAVVLNEDRGLGALGRSWALTRGLTLRLIGVALLFGLVLLITATAAGTITGIVIRLFAGAGGIAAAQFGAGVASAGVQAAFVAIVQSFAARLYLAVAPAPPRPVAADVKRGPWG